MKMVSSGHLALNKALYTNANIPVGNWRGLVPIPKIDLEGLEQRLDGEEKNRFLHFIRKMLCWTPEERPTAGEIIYDPWLMEGLFDP
jgi:serine/threonine-protein kinase SRPK3